MQEKTTAMDARDQAGEAAVLPGGKRADGKPHPKKEVIDLIQETSSRNPSSMLPKQVVFPRIRGNR